MNQERSTLDCSYVVGKTNGIRGPEAKYGAYDYPVSIGSMYLGQVVVWLWKINGEMDWAVTHKLGYLFFALTIVISYILLLCFFPFAYSLIGSLFWMSSPFHLAEFPHLRDYSKAVFFVGALFVLKKVIDEKRVRWRYFYSATLGAILGIGCGFRADLKILLPLIVIVFIIQYVSLKNKEFITSLRRVIGLLLVLIFTFYLLYLPVSLKLKDVENRFSYDSGLYHVTLLGLYPYPGEEIVVKESVIKFLPFFEDIYLSMKLNGFSKQSLGQEAVMATDNYRVAGKEYLMNILTSFPSTFMRRGLEAFWVSFSLPFKKNTQNFHLLKVCSFSFCEKVGEITVRTKEFFTSISYIREVSLTLGILISLFVFRMKSLLIFYSITLYLMLYPAIQLSPRHYFQNELLSLIILLFVLSTLFSRSFWGSRIRFISFVKRLLIGIVSFLLIFLTFYYYEQNVVGKFIENDLKGARKTVVGGVWKDLGGEGFSFTPKLKMKYTFEYLEFNFSLDCKEGSLTFYGMEKDGSKKVYDTISLGRFSKAYYPVYEKSFKGVGITDRNCITSVKRIILSKKLPIHLYVFLTKS
ncbi:hypothetical protein [Halobacteriovorax sp. JY17]|uniref:hypothetical protein n=1 Tax=Halobacteriovorax sp. JY17 TaxID=2014617 RepID=UPI0025C3EEDC|nr:hypothetical protein [Halobacteriovorax sp. JY17]